MANKTGLQTSNVIQKTVINNDSKGVAETKNGSLLKVTVIALTAVAAIAALSLLEVQYKALSGALTLAIANPMVSISILLCVVGGIILLAIYARKPAAQNQQKVVAEDNTAKKTDTPNTSNKNSTVVDDTKTEEEKKLEQPKDDQAKVEEEKKLEQQKTDQAKVEEEKKLEQPKVDNTKIEEEKKLEQQKTDQAKIEEEKKLEQQKTDQAKTQEQKKDTNNAANSSASSASGSATKTNPATTNTSPSTSKDKAKKGLTAIQYNVFDDEATSVKFATVAFSKRQPLKVQYDTASDKPAFLALCGEYVEFLENKVTLLVQQEKANAKNSNGNGYAAATNANTVRDLLSNARTNLAFFKSDYQSSLKIKEKK